MKPAIFNVSTSYDSHPGKIAAETASRKKGVSAGRQAFRIDGVMVSLDEMVKRTGMERRAIQAKYSSVLRKRPVTMADFA